MVSHKTPNARTDKDDSRAINLPDRGFAVPFNAPPPYELQSVSDLLATSSAITGDGTLNIDFASSASGQIDELLPPLPPLAEPEKTQILAGAHCPPLNIVLQIVGSRGDVQPFIALGIELKKYGHRIRLATHDVFAKFVRASGLEFYPVGGDPEDLMSYMVRNPGLLPSVESLRGGDVTRKRRMMHEMLQGFWAACVRPDPVSHRPFVANAIIANPPSFAHVHLGQALGVPVHMMFTMPWTATRAFSHPLANVKAEGIGESSANYLTYGIVEWMTWQGLGDIINDWRVKDLNLEPVPAMVGPDVVSQLEIPHTYCWSPALVDKPRDWGSNIAPAYMPPDDLANFLAAGTVPIYIGFGSIVLEDTAAMTETLIQACKAAGVRAIISRGWSKLGGNDSGTENIFYLGDCPHEWLFKRVSVVVHHGGAGTTACGLYNARPTVIVPFFGDQPFWGRLVARRGAGPLPIPHKTLTSQRLADAIRFCLTPDAQRTARCIAEQMSRENGVEAAVQSFHRRILPLDLSCDILPDFAAEWIYYPTNSRTANVKLSHAALRILIAKNKLSPQAVKPYRLKEYHIVDKPRDPLSASAFSTLRVITNFTSAIGGTFINPFKEYKRTEKAGGSGNIATAGAVGKGFAFMGSTLTRGALVDMPLSIAEGFRNVPKIYGGEVREHENVTDLKSGGAVAGKNFGVGFYEGITDIVTQPYKGAKEDGAVGFMKGVALFGLLAYPAQGLYKSIKSQTHKDANAKINEAKSAALNDEQPEMFYASQVIQTFQSMTEARQC